MTEINTVSSLEIARQFYLDHELDFQRAHQLNKTEERGFDFTADMFDDWAVDHGWMDGCARNTSGVERDGLTQQRFRLRHRLNNAARSGVGLLRAFSVEARGGRWRVDLSERFVFERPKEIIRGLKSTFTNTEGQIEKTRELIKAQEYLSDEDRAVLLANLSMASMFIFNNLQNVEMIAIMAASGKTPDFRDLHRKMSRSISVDKKAPARSRKKARKRITG